MFQHESWIIRFVYLKVQIQRFQPTLYLTEQLLRNVCIHIGISELISYNWIEVFTSENSVALLRPLNQNDRIAPEIMRNKGSLSYKPI